jgi:nicotinate phosphoribosyltransferase
MIERAFGLTTDLYELTMAAAYFENGLHPRAIFELFVRKLPERRSYLIVAGLEQALDYLSTLRFKSDQIDYLREHPSFKRVSREFFDYLAEFRFTGDVCAMPEGTAAFGMEPLLRITAPIIEAQVVETFLLSTINFQTMIASKAARVVTAARGRTVIEFGTRRAHGTEAGLLAARAAYIGGCIGTSNVEAGHLFGIPTFGTLAHSFVMSFEDEDESFRAFLKVFPETATVLVDTYDTIAAVERLARGFGPTIPAVRLDSGDLCELSKQVREILDEAGMTGTKIFASGDLNEYKIADLISGGAQIDSFGVGTELATSFDAPALSGVYKLAGLEENGHVSMRIKLSHDKATYPGPKQVWRLTDESGSYNQDIITLADEPNNPTGSWHPLLKKVMKEGRVVEGFDNRGD